MRLLRTVIVAGSLSLSAAAGEAQVADTAATKVPASAGPQEVKGLVLPTLEDRLVVLGVSIVLSSGLLIIINEKRKRADRERAG